MRAQVSFEMMIYAGVLLVIIAIISILVINIQNRVDESVLDDDAQEIAFLLANEINIAADVGDGYSHSFFLPSTLKDNVIYNIVVNTQYQAVNIQWSGGNYAVPIVTGNVTTISLVKGASNKIRNINGEIRLE